MGNVKLIKLEPCPSPTNMITTATRKIATTNTNNELSPYKCDIKISHPMSWALESYMYEKQSMTYRNKSVKSTSKSALSAQTSSSSTTSIAGGGGGGGAGSGNGTGTGGATGRNTSSSSLMVRNVPAMRRVKRDNTLHSEMIYDGNESKPWICRACNRKYKWKNSLNCHIKNECGKPPKFYCERMCGYKTNINSNLKRHMNSNCKPHMFHLLDGTGNLV